ncbi:ProQ/FINO family protein [Pseudorhodoferax sp. Leaf267]|uniref:ProQ/FINO family protein n=1 Tax=Pseudorhodoferax sp. Leaf267 TaxID=1736316 RepID=UPI0009EA59AB|nr:ProQ/FINO family protein [Pseudorhodoferax sp. Leaf267]
MSADNLSPATEPADAVAEGKPGKSRRRHQRPDPAAQARRGRPVHPVLEQLAALHPQLFGSRFLPLKLGTFQDIMERHAGVFEAAALKEALGQHTRSTRYLESIARGVPRHDLDGKPAGELAIDHVHHAAMELFRRRQARSTEDLQPAMRARLRELFVASGLDRAGYAAAAKINPDVLGALLDQSDLDQAGEIARREALMRAFEASGTSMEAFADSYGMQPGVVAKALAQAADDRRVKAAR